MRLRSKLLIALVALGILVVIGMLFIREKEPSYNGHPLSYWVSHSYTRNPDEYALAKKAVQAIGTNAIPYFDKWVRYKPSPLRRSVNRNLPAALRRPHPGVLALRGFGLLGPDCSPAAAHLAAIMQDTSQPVPAELAMYALSRMGVAGLPHLSAALADTNLPFRGEILVQIGSEMLPAIGTNRCLSAIQPALQDPDFEIRVGASNFVNHLTPKTKSVSPSPPP